MADTNIQITVTDNSPEVLKAIPIAIKRALWAVGAACEGHAKTNETRVDTGLLRNSITFAVGGESPNITSYKADKPDKSGVVKTGSYSGKADPGDKVYIGSAVEYAAAHELGTSRGIKPLHFMQNAVANNTAEYKSLIRQSFENV